MKISIPILFALFCLGSAPAVADSCMASGSLHAQLTRPHFYVFSGDVQATGCAQYMCTGWVHYVATTQFPTGGTAKERFVDQYSVPAGSSSTHISNEHAIEGDAVIDVGVEGVTCKSP